MRSAIKSAIGAAVMALGLGAAAIAAPQAAAPDADGIRDADAPAAADSSPALAEPEKDLFDVLREWRHKPPPPTSPDDYKKWMVAAAPVISYSPTSGAGIGLAGNVAFYRGFPATTQISSIVGSVIATTKSQVLVSAKVSASALENRWRLEGDNRLYWTSQETFGLGTQTARDDAVDMKYDYFRFYDRLFRKVSGHSYVGGGLLYNLHTDVRAPEDVPPEEFAGSPYITYSEKSGFDPASQTSAGASLHALVDSRDSAINPGRGWYAHLSYLMFFEGFLGGTSNWQQLSYDLRTYLRLNGDGRHKLAFWTFADLVTGGTAPYLDLPATGTDTYTRSGRGYPQGRFRGERMVYGEAEYRWTITRNGLLGMVGFVNTETLSNEQTGEKLFDSFATGLGAGLRAMLNRRSKTNLCFDVGYGAKDHHTAIYFAVQEAF